MSAWRARLAVLAVFLLGFVSGAATLQLVRVRFESRIFHSPDPVLQVFVYKLDQELKLDDDQRRKLLAEMHEARVEVIAATGDLLPKLAAILDRCQQRMSAHLTPAQKEKFARIVEERKRYLTDPARLR